MFELRIMNSTLKWMAVMVFIARAFAPHVASGFRSLQSTDSLLGAPSLVPAIAPRPNPNNTAVFARWLVSQTTWGVARNVRSFSHGMLNKGTGIPYFYMSTLDETPTDALQDPRASFTISEETIGTGCIDDPEIPDCARSTLSGKLIQLAEDKPEGIFGKAAIIAKHSDFQYLPPDHSFQVYKLVLEDIFLLDNFGGASYLTPDEYFKAS